MAVHSGITAVPTPPRPLSRTECRDWLSHHRQGRLRYLSGRGPRAVVVSYALAGDQIMLRVPDYNDIAHYAPGAEIRLEVSDDVPAGSEEVSVVGTAALADRAQAPLIEQADFEEEWPSGIATAVVCLPLTTVEGYETANS